MSKPKGEWIDGEYRWAPGERAKNGYGEDCFIVGYRENGVLVWDRDDLLRTLSDESRRPIPPPRTIRQRQYVGGCGHVYLGGGGNSVLGEWTIGEDGRPLKWERFDE